MPKTDLKLKDFCIKERCALKIQIASDPQPIHTPGRSSLSFSSKGSLQKDRDRCSLTESKAKQSHIQERERKKLKELKKAKKMEFE